MVWHVERSTASQRGAKRHYGAMPRRAPLFTVNGMVLFRKQPATAAPVVTD